MLWNALVVSDLAQSDRPLREPTHAPAAGVLVTVWGGTPGRLARPAAPTSGLVVFLAIYMLGWFVGTFVAIVVLDPGLPDENPWVTGAVRLGVWLVLYALSAMPKCAWPWERTRVLMGPPSTSGIVELTSGHLRPIGAVVLSARGIDHTGRWLGRPVRETIPWRDVAEVHVFGRGLRSEDRGVRIELHDGRCEVWAGRPSARVVGGLAELGADVRHLPNR